MAQELKNHASLEIQSRDRVSGTEEDFKVHFNYPITFKQNHNIQYFVRAENIQMPISFYNINSYNNTFIVNETDGVTPIAISVSVSAGNYNIIELITELEALLDAESIATGYSADYTLSYSEITNKITIKFDSSGGTPTSASIDTIANGSLLNEPLGLGIGDTTYITGRDNAIALADGVDSVGSYQVDLSYTKFINIITNIATDNYHASDEVQNLLCRLPITQDRNQIEYFENHDGHLALLSSRIPVRTIEIRLQDDRNRNLELNDVDWNLNLCFYEYHNLPAMLE